MDRRELWIDPQGTIAVSDLAEYAYCPRALHYRLNPPAVGPEPRVERLARRGSEFHARQLAGVRRRESNARSWWLLLAISAFGLAALATLGVLGWT